MSSPAHNVNTSTIRVQDATPGDIPSITAIYATQVLETINTYEYVPPTEEDMKARMETILANGFPYLVARATSDGSSSSELEVVVGYAYASTFRAREAYRFTVEGSVYVHPAHQRRGAGRALLDGLIAECERRGFRAMVAVIGDTENRASVELHKRCGFEEVGVMKGVAWKMGRWLDTLMMRRGLSPVDSSRQ